MGTSGQIKGTFLWVSVFVFAVLLFAGLCCFDTRPEQTLCEIVFEGDAKGLKQYLDSDTDINIPDENGFAPLHYAIQIRRSDIVDILLASGANVNQSTLEGDTPLHFSVAQNKELFTEKLLTAGADPNAVNKNRETPLGLAVIANSPSVSLLLDNGAVPNDDTCPGDGYLFCAARSGCVVMLEELVLGLEDLNRLSPQGISALQYAVHNRHLEAVCVLLESGADLNVRDKRGWTPLHQAVRTSSSEIVRVLAENGADLEIRDNSGHTPLLAAGRVGHLDDVRILVRQGADLDSKNSEQKSIDDYARINHRAEIRTFLAEYRREMVLRKNTPVRPF